MLAVFGEREVYKPSVISIHLFHSFIDLELFTL